jgi:hypothetical protein
MSGATKVTVEIGETTFELSWDGRYIFRVELDGERVDSWVDPVFFHGNPTPADVQKYANDKVGYRSEWLKY